MKLESLERGFSMPKTYLTYIYKVRDDRFNIARDVI